MDLLRSKWALQLLVVVFCLSTARTYKILGVAHFGARSHFIVCSSLLKQLAREGHEVTVITPFPQKEPLQNYHDVPVPGVFKAMEAAVAGLLDSRDHNIVRKLFSIHELGYRVTEATLGEPTVQALMQSNQTFDVVIAEVFMSEALYGLAEHFKAPLIGLSTFGAITWNTDMVGSPSPPSYVPHALGRLTDRMTLSQRISNLALLTFERLFLDFYYLPRQESLYRQYFPHIERPMRDILKNTALVLLNQHVSLGFPRPYVPNQIEVGGMHINRKRTPLPADIQKFLDEAKHGAIYFSMGSNLKSKDLPLEKRQAFLDTFRGLKQRVLWKFEDPNLAGKPDNVYISDWFPQDDILAHKNVLAFITHGGLLSTTESIYHGKPFVGIPIFGDQFLNMGLAEANGYGIMLDYLKLSSTTFKSAIDRILNEPSYTNLVRDMSARYRDQPMQPLELAVYWVEHVARHKGARYLRNAGQDLNFIQYHNIDAMLILYGGVLLAFGCIIWGLGLIFCMLRRAFTKLDKSRAQSNTKSSIKKQKKH